jgi:hypothetical protein
LFRRAGMMTAMTKGTARSRRSAKTPNKHHLHSPHAPPIPKNRHPLLSQFSVLDLILTKPFRLVVIWLEKSNVYCMDTKNIFLLDISLGETVFVCEHFTDKIRVGFFFY